MSANRNLSWLKMCLSVSKKLTLTIAHRGITFSSVAVQIDHDSTFDLPEVSKVVPSLPPAAEGESRVASGAGWCVLMEDVTRWMPHSNSHPTNVTTPLTGLQNINKQDLVDLWLLYQQK